MKNIFNKLKKTISFYILILSILFLVVGLVFKCVYIYEYKHVSDDIKNCIQNGTKYVCTTYWGDEYSESFSDLKYIDYYTKTMLNMQKEEFNKYYNDIPSNIIIISIVCLCVFGFACYIKIRPKKQVEISQKYTNQVSKHNTVSYSPKPTVECPYCHSTNTKKISGVSKAGSVALFGIFAAGKVSKQWNCNQCGSGF